MTGPAPSSGLPYELARIADRPYCPSDVRALLRRAAGRLRSYEVAAWMRQFARSIVLVASLLGWASSAAAQPANPIAWSIEHQTIARRTSDVLVLGQEALSVLHAWRQPDRKRAVLAHACSVGVTLGAVEVLKRVTRERRPDGSDRLSFPSGHTATAASAAGWNPPVGWALTISTAYLRSAGNKHHWWDTVAGAALGAAAHQLCEQVRTR